MFEGKGLTQRVMAKMIDSNPSTINKFISLNGYSPLPQNSQKNFRYSIDDSRKILNSLYSSKYEVTKKVLSFYNFKGGVGKTSICFQISAFLSLIGFRVLAVDADPQGHLSTSLGYDGSENLYTLYDVISGNMSVEDVIKTVYPGLDLIPANLSLTKIENLLNDLPKREERVRISLQGVSDLYDFIVFDTNPTISHLNKNIISYSDFVNIVVETQAYALNGLKILMADLESFCNKMQMNFPEHIIIPNKYEDRASNSVEAMSALVEYYSSSLKPNFAIRRSEDFNTSAKNSNPLPFFARTNSIALEDIIEVGLYILGKVTKPVKKA